MTVEELIDLLNTVSDKSKEVTVNDYSYDDTEYTIKCIEPHVDRIIIQLNDIY